MYNFRIPFKNLSSFIVSFLLVPLSLFSIFACSDNGSGSNAPTVASSEDLGLCSAENEGSSFYVAVDNGKYTCSGGTWIAVPNLSECTDENENSVVQETNKADYFYGFYFTCESQEWRKASTPEIISGKACNASIEGSFTADTVYSSSSSKTYFLDYSSSSAAVPDTAISFEVNRWVCDGNVWRGLTTGEYLSNIYCNDKTNGIFTVDSSDLSNIRIYVCDNYKWRAANEKESLTQSLCSESSLGKVVNGYICSTLGWRVATVFESAVQTLCTTDNAGEFVNATYPTGTTLTIDSESVTYSSPVKLLTICDSGWRLATNFEKSVGVICNEEREGQKKIDTTQKKIISSYNAYYVAYICKKSFWRELPEGEFGYGAPCTPELEGITYTDSSEVRIAGKNRYTCSDSRWQN